MKKFFLAFWNLMCDVGEMRAEAYRKHRHFHY